MKKPHITSSKTVYHSQLFDIVSDDITLRSGKKVTWEHVVRHPTVVVFPLTPKEEIYLIKEYRVLFQRTLLEAVAGHLDDNENALSGAKRELLEETGIV